MRWLEEMLEHAYSRMTIVLVGNKKDLAEDRQVTYEEGMEFAKKNKLIFFETSAKSSENVEETFNHATKVIYSNVSRGDVYDLANESIGIKPGNARANQNMAAATIGQRIGGLQSGGIKKQKDGGCC